MLKVILKAVGYAAVFAIAASGSVQAGSCAAPASGTFPTKWIDGTGGSKEPRLQVHEYNGDFYILRQSLRTSFEGPFLYLIFGKNSALLIDTGDGLESLRNAVDTLIASWLQRNKLANVDLIVAHSHGHGDHIAGDSDFRDRPNTKVVGTQIDQVKSFFGFRDWPDDRRYLDLGGRRIDVIAIPGHSPAHVAFYDSRTRILMSGDTFYPGRLYFPVGSFGDYRASVSRLAKFADANAVCWLLGAHIEMTVHPGRDFPGGVTQHPDEHVLQLKHSDIAELDQFLAQMPEPKLERRDHYIIYPLGR